MVSDKADARDPVLPHALPSPAMNRLRGKRVVLASASPRRIDILRTYGLSPEVVPSDFPEKLSKSDGAHEYVSATSAGKALDVYERLVKSDERDPPDLVIGADTIVVLAPPDSTILEKPRDVTDQLEMLTDYNGAIVDVCTAVTLIQPQIASPGYSVRSLVVSTSVHFADNPPSRLRAYVHSKEGLDRAGGFAIQGLGGLLIKKIDGDYNNCVGFPAQAFFDWLETLADDGELLEMD